MMKKTLLALTSCTLLIVACTSASHESNGAPSPDDVETFCKADRNRYAACEKPEERTKDDAECRETQGPCVLKYFRPDAIKPLETCLESIRCTTSATGNCQCERSEDACYAEVAKSLPPTPTADAYERTCRTKLAACGEKQIPEDTCVNVTLANDAFYDAVRPCFDLACDAVQACYRGKLETIGCR
jgi:hypothetical protein